MDERQQGCASEHAIKNYGNNSVGPVVSNSSSSTWRDKESPLTNILWENLLFVFSFIQGRAQKSSALNSHENFSKLYINFTKFYISLFRYKMKLSPS